LSNILLGTLMMIVTTGVHSVFTIISLRVLSRWLHNRHSTIVACARSTVAVERSG
jgi:hypothetical protein